LTNAQLSPNIGIITACLPIGACMPKPRKRPVAALALLIAAGCAAVAMVVRKIRPR
jgi:hypothetical protein